MARWLESGAASVSAAGTEITCTDNTDFSTVKAGDLVMLAGQLWQAASGSKPDADGQSVLSLHSAWPYDAVEEGSLYVIRTTHELHRLATEIPNLAQITKALLASLEFVLTSDQETIAIPIGTDPVTGEPRTITVTPWQYILDSLSDMTSSIAEAQQAATEASAARDAAVAAAAEAQPIAEELSGKITQAESALESLQSAAASASSSAEAAADSAKAAAVDAGVASENRNATDSLLGLMSASQSEASGAASAARGAASAAQQSASEAAAARETAVAAANQAQPAVQQLTDKISEADAAIAAMEAVNNTASASAEAAAASASTAGENEVAASASADRAEAARQAAETAQSQAEAVVYSGGASSTPEQGKTPIALAGGVLGMGWLDLLSLRLTQLQTPFVHVFAPGRLTVTDDVSVTVQRASPATYIDRLGRVLTAAANEPREQAGGWLLEPEGVNLCAKSEGFTAEDNGWSTPIGGTSRVISVLAPDGETYWTEYRSGTNYNSPNLRHSVIPDRDGPLVASWFVMRDPGATRADATLSYGVSAGDGPDEYSRIYLDWATGDLKVDKPNVTRLLRCSSQRLAADIYRVEIALEALATDTKVDFGYTGNGKVLGSQSGRLWGMQIEWGTHASSYMPRTIDKPGTRAADVVTLSGSVTPDMQTMSITATHKCAGRGTIYQGLDARGAVVIECSEADEELCWKAHDSAGASLILNLTRVEGGVVHSALRPDEAGYTTYTAQSAESNTTINATPKLYAPITTWRFAPTAPVLISNFRVFDIALTNAEARLIL